MMANCADNVYVIKYTDKSKGTITITKSSLVTNLVDIALVGKSRLDYGEVFNENMLRLLENFACPATPGDINSPDLDVAFGTVLNNPVGGQRWFNSTANRMYVYNGNLTEWVPLAREGDIAGNSGVIAHGSFLPRPVGYDGYIFPYEECNMVVSHHSGASTGGNDVPGNTEMDYVRCFVESNGRVTVQFRYAGESALRNGYANYKIIGIRGETNTPIITVTPYPVPDPTPNVSPTSTPTPTPTPVGTKAPTPTPTRTQAVSVPASNTPTPTQTRTPTPTPTRTPSQTPPVTPTPSTQTVVTAPGFNISAGSPEGEGAIAYGGLVFTPDGNAQGQSSSTGSQNRTWLQNGNASNYEIFVTEVHKLTAGSSISFSGALNTWLNMGTDRTWSAQVGPMPNNLSNGTIEWQIDYQIRNISTGAIVSSGGTLMHLYVGQPI